MFIAGNAENASQTDRNWTHDHTVDGDDLKAERGRACVFQYVCIQAE